MTPRSFVSALVASLLVYVPAAQAAPAYVALSVGAGDCTTLPGTCSGISPGANVTLTCAAGGTTFYPVGSISVSADAGVLGVPVTALSAVPATSTVTWTAPASGSATLTCNGTLSNNAPISPSSQVIAQVAAPVANTPVITALDRPTGPVLAGATVALAVTATDPLGGALSYAWSASGGSFDTASAAAVNWTAPATEGPFDVTVAVSNTTGTSTRMERFQVVLSVFQGGLSTLLRAPRRLAAAGGGDIAVADGEGRLYLLTRRGELRGAPVLDAPVSAVAASNGTVYAATRNGMVLTIDAATGQVLRRLRLGTAGGPNAMAWDETNGLLWMVEPGMPGARALHANGTVARELRETPAGQALQGVTDVAVDGAGNVWLAQASNESGPMIHAFNAATGAHLRSIVAMGTGPGQVLRVGGIGFDQAGRLFVTDVFSGNVKVLSPDGTALGTFGSFGSAPGQLRQPVGVAPMVNGDVLVANFELGRLERFGGGLPLPTCAVGGQVDSDCDGLPDVWELANGFDPFDPSDAMRDTDGDGLTNGEEFAQGTNPRNVDSDGDGVSDKAELLAGTNPNDANDLRAMMSASGPDQVRPGEVRLAATVSGPGSCSQAWRQVSGPPVVLRAATSLTPSFIARSAGTYAFEGQATCGGSQSAPSQVAVRVLNVAPRAVADRVVVVAAGDRLELSAAASSDANGDVLRFEWEADESPAGATAAIALHTRELGLGYHPFRALVRDPAGLIDAVDVPVMVVDERLAAPTAIVDDPVLSAEVGQVVQLSAAASIGPAVRWEQLSGPSAALSDAASAMPTFQPAVAGRYVFNAWAVDGLAWSAPARVEVFVAGSGSALPLASAAPVTPVVPINTALVIDGSGSHSGAGGALGYAWRQVAGPAAALVDEDRPLATAVAFVPGWYEFELVVAEAGVSSLPVRVGFEARRDSAPIPVARAAAPADAVAGELVRLDGRASSGGRRYRWTQVAGPWVALKASHPAPTFVPTAEGTYRFELEVDDGTVRSRPVSVTLIVVGKG